MMSLRLLALAAVGLVSFSAQAQDGINISGDFRYRHEGSTVENNGNERNRVRHRVRARIKLEGEVNETMSAGVRLVTGGENELRSSNQTLGGDLQYKSVNFDQIYFVWQAQEELALTGGKIANPFYMAGGNQMVWDSDITLEGMALVYKTDTSEEGLFARAGTFYLRENSSGDDQGLFAWQVGYGLGNFKLGFAQYHHDLLEDAVAMDGGLNGNTGYDNAGSEFYDVSINTYEAFLEWSGELLGRPFGVYASYGYNNHTDDKNQSYIAGFDFDSSEDNPFSVMFNYRDIQADALVASFTESDFAGGQTNVRGTTIGLGYQLAQNAALSLTQYSFETGVDTDSPESDSLYQIDFKLKF